MQNHSCRITFILALCVLAMSCGTSTQNQRMPISGTASSRPAPSASPTASLPPYATIDFTGRPLLEVIFRTQLNVNRLDDLYATTKGKVDNLSVVSNCDLDVLKGFVATGWAPIVLLHSGGRRLWAVAGYDDAARQMQVENPITRGVRILIYSDFEREWATGSGNKCVLVTPGRLTEARVNSELGKYLPSAQVSQVKVRSR